MGSIDAQLRKLRNRHSDVWCAVRRSTLVSDSEQAALQRLCSAPLDWYHSSGAANLRRRCEGNGIYYRELRNSNRKGSIESKDKDTNEEGVSRGCEAVSSIVSDKVERDIGRTFSAFGELRRQRRARLKRSLRRVLLAHCRVWQSGYCQGQNFIAAMLLLDATARSTQEHGNEGERSGRCGCASNGEGNKDADADVEEDEDEDEGRDGDKDGGEDDDDDDDEDEDEDEDEERAFWTYSALLSSSAVGPVIFGSSAPCPSVVVTGFVPVPIPSHVADPSCDVAKAKAKAKEAVVTAAGDAAELATQFSVAGGASGSSTPSESGCSDTSASVGTSARSSSTSTIGSVDILPHASSASASFSAPANMPVSKAASALSETRITADAGALSIERAQDQGQGAMCFMAVKLFMHHVRCRLPLLHQRLTDMDFPTETVALQWLSTCFAEVLDLSAAFAVMDALLIGVPSVLWRVGLAVFQLLERPLFSGSFETIMGKARAAHLRGLQAVKLLSTALQQQPMIFDAKLEIAAAPAVDELYRYEFDELSLLAAANTAAPAFARVHASVRRWRAHAHGYDTYELKVALRNHTKEWLQEPYETQGGSGDGAVGPAGLGIAAVTAAPLTVWVRFSALHELHARILKLAPPETCAPPAFPKKVWLASSRSVVASRRAAVADKRVAALDAYFRQLCQWLSTCLCECSVPAPVSTDGYHGQVDSRMAVWRTRLNRVLDLHSVLFQFCHAARSCDPDRHSDLCIGVAHSVCHSPVFAVHA